MKVSGEECQGAPPHRVLAGRLRIMVLMARRRGDEAIALGASNAGQPTADSRCPQAGSTCDAWDFIESTSFLNHFFILAGYY